MKQSLFDYEEASDLSRTIMDKPQPHNRELSTGQLLGLMTILGVLLWIIS